MKKISKCMKRQCCDENMISSEKVISYLILTKIQFIK